ncbi:XRE family transcriptional regulator [Alicyclobacillus suci]|uniref:XRE family transcriptional regulator n=1 Tax=Alicyclobacillus suci TaxID=2816080 RepID=UPI001A8C9D4C
MRHIRREHNLSLDELAEKTGVSKLTLEKFERGEANPTLAMMWKIPRGLSVPLTALLVMEEQVGISRSGEGFQLVGGDGNWVIEPMFTMSTYGTTGLSRAFLEPHSQFTERHHAGSVEITMVMSGSLSILVERTEHGLNFFDSIRFHADCEHTYLNASDTPVVFHFDVDLSQPRLRNRLSAVRGQNVYFIEASEWRYF